MNSILSSAINFITDYLLFETLIAAVLVTVALGIIRLGRIKAPVHRHMVWLFTLVAIAIMPALWLYGPKLTLSILPLQDSIGLSQLADLQPAWLPDNYASWSLLKGFNILALLWCTGFVFLMTRLLVSGFRLSRIIHAATPVAENLLPSKISSKKINLLLTRQVHSPVCLGLFRPIILLPELMYHNSSREELHMVLRHEYAHIVRKDCWVNLFQRVIEAFLFFHPLVWYASLQLTHQREQLCDNHVIADGISPTNYVKMLSRIVEQGFEKRCFHTVALFEGKLLTRVRSLLEPGNKNLTKASRRATVTGLFVMLMFLAIGTIQIEAIPNVNDPQGQISGEEKQSQAESLLATVYKLNEVDKVPRPIRTYPPMYPVLAKEKEIVGRVVLQFVIGADGYAHEPRVVSAEPEGVFENSALDAIVKYTFEPALKNGKPVACIAKLPIAFSLD